MPDSLSFGSAQSPSGTSVQRDVACSGSAVFITPVPALAVFDSVAQAAPSLYTILPMPRDAVASTSTLVTAGAAGVVLSEPPPQPAIRSAAAAARVWRG